MSGRSLEVRVSVEGAPLLTYHFERSPVLVGRGASCELCLPLKAVSAHHLSLTWGAQGVCARDLDAKNKAEIGGVPLTGERCAPRRLTLSLPGARLEVRCVKRQRPASTQEERARHLLTLVSAARGWLVEWRPHEPHVYIPPQEPPHTPHTPHPPQMTQPLPTRSVLPLPFGERLKLRAELTHVEGLPQELLNEELELSAEGWGVEVMRPTGERVRLTPERSLSFSTGELRIVSASRPSLSASPPHPHPLSWARHLALTLTTLILIGLISALLSRS